MIGLLPSDITSRVPSFRYTTYSYKEGILGGFIIIAIALILALINMIISLIIGIRRKDCLVVLVVNVMLKTLTMSLKLILYNLYDLNNLFIDILFFLAIIIIEGFIYKKVLKYKKRSGMTVSIVCNIGAVVIVVLMGSIFDFSWMRNLIISIF